MTTMDVITSDADQLRAVFPEMARTFYEDFNAVSELDGASRVGLPLRAEYVPKTSATEPFAILRLDESSGEHQVLLRERQVKDGRAIGHKLILGFSLTEEGEVETTKRYVTFTRSEDIGVIERSGREQEIGVKDYVLLHLVFDATSRRRQQLEAKAARQSAQAA